MSNYTNPELLLKINDIEPGDVCWKSPSNIAIIKYWGKYAQQLPRNPSLSFTLDNAHTFTVLSYEAKESKGISFDVYFGGEKNMAFKPKIQKFLEQILSIYPFIEQLHFKIESENTFPHSAGIASSASSMSALALCLCSLEQRFFKTLNDQDEFLRKASYLARIGSGSACRSVFPIASVWGETELIKGSSNLFGVPVKDELHEVFHTFHDDIMIVNDEEKSVSSSAGHELMENNPFASTRYQQANERLKILLKALKDGNVEAFGQICEEEALSLHALMMLSTPSYLLIKPATISIIEEIRQFRKETKVPVYFTLDAGPNVHVLYPDLYKQVVTGFINQKLAPYCISGNYIEDHVGLGPVFG